VAVAVTGGTALIALGASAGFVTTLGGLGVATAAGTTYYQRREEAIAAGTDEGNAINGRAAVAAAGDLVLGASGFYEGITGTNAARGLELDTQQRSERFGNALGGLATEFLAVDELSALVRGRSLTRPQASPTQLRAPTSPGGLISRRLDENRRQIGEMVERLKGSSARNQTPSGGNGSPLAIASEGNPAALTRTGDEEGFGHFLESRNQSNANSSVGNTGASNGDPKVIDGVTTSPYHIKINPGSPGMPDPAWTVDSTNFTRSTGKPSHKGFPRNSKEFWLEWAITHPKTLSQTNLRLINGIDPKTGKRLTRTNKKTGQKVFVEHIAPKVDDVWLKSFPEHADYKWNTIEHHHVDEGRWVIPLPEKLHRLDGNYRKWHPDAP